MQVISRFNGLRLRPLAGCLAAALTLATGTAAAAVVPHKVPTAAAELMDRLHSGMVPDLPSRATLDPAAITTRWQPLPHVIPDIPANSIVVQNCNDSGAGSLRQALTDAQSGDTVDLTQLSCSSITLTSGSIAFTQGTITLQGPGSKYLSISGGDNFAPLLHDATGTLYINDLTVEHGKKYFTSAQVDDARGGCIFSGGTVIVSDSVVEYCVAQDTNSSTRAFGGAIYGQYGISLSNSSVFNSSATSAYEADGGGLASPGSITVTDSYVGHNFTNDHGGGIYAGDLKVKYSIIDANQGNAIGGGTYSFGNVTIENSTISNNVASLGGGAFMNALNATQPATLLSSTVSGNSAGKVGGVWIGDYTGGSVRVANSTIAFNYESNTSKYGAGLFLYGTVDVESTIIDNNSYAGGSNADDVGGKGSPVFDGSNNLVGFSLVTPPSDTIEEVPAKLGPLAFNGGTTPTHRLMTSSPAINAGNDLANVSYDQRGDGFPRTIGSATDIGAFELDTSDEIFSDGFDN